MITLRLSCYKAKKTVLVVSSPSILHTHIAQTLTAVYCDVDALRYVSSSMLVIPIQVSHLHGRRSGYTAQGSTGEARLMIYITVMFIIAPSCTHPQNPISSWHAVAQ